MDSLEAVQKSHQERVNELTDRLQKAEYSVRVLYIPDTEGVAKLEKELDVTRRRSIHAAEISGNLRAQIAELEKQLVGTQSQLIHQTDRAITLSNMLYVVDQKIDAIKKFLDSRRADGFTSFVMQTIENILGGN